MNEKELRYGNWILDHGHPTKVDFYFFMQRTFEYSDPILLTEEILLKAGFIPYIQGEIKGMQVLLESAFNTVLVIADNYTFIELNLEVGTHKIVLHQERIALHTLQNLFYALTKKELEINLWDIQKNLLSK